MKVFISWSGDESKLFAEKLHDWLPQVIQALDPWMSSQDIALGQRGIDEIAAKLNEYHFGLLCLTPENRESKWIHFEAGALSKAIDKSKVIPLCIRMKTSELTPPLSQFQATQATEDGVKKLVVSLNRELHAPLAASHLEKAFELHWPSLKDLLARPYNAANAPPKRSADEMIEEMLILAREQARVNPQFYNTRLLPDSDTPLREHGDASLIFRVLATEVLEQGLSVDWRSFSLGAPQLHLAQDIPGLAIRFEINNHRLEILLPQPLTLRTLRATIVGKLEVAKREVLIQEAKQHHFPRLL